MGEIGKDWGNIAEDLRIEHGSGASAKLLSKTALQRSANMYYSWCKTRRERFAKKNVLDQATDGARPKLFTFRKATALDLKRASVAQT